MPQHRRQLANVSWVLKTAADIVKVCQCFHSVNKDQTGHKAFQVDDHVSRTESCLKTLEIIVLYNLHYNITEWNVGFNWKSKLFQKHRYFDSQDNTKKQAFKREETQYSALGNDQQQTILTNSQKTD